MDVWHSYGPSGPPCMTFDEHLRRLFTVAPPSQPQQSRIGHVYFLSLTPHLVLRELKLLFPNCATNVVQGGLGEHFEAGCMCLADASASPLI